ncbi:dTDP-glucose 4,6-dehydratase [Candidatus Pelagibacter bacterium nBUS_25]|uniref:dTDP-glucose 4,6-dehydratase n=1 Tax=Candidatus Pelagibacter bacterium nBUS_25 TaxID=3374187 RepID=UPI003EBADFD5
MELLVTGGLGFIGINFIIHALKKKIKIINVDKITYASNKEKKFLKNFNNYKFYKTDITNKKKFKNILKKNLPDFIINFAAETHVDRSIVNSKSFIKTNIIGVHTILECCKELQSLKKIKLIQISTDEVYGSLKYTGSFKEGDIYKPNSPYSASKAAADHLVRSYRITFDVPSIIVHPSNNFGPYQNPEKLMPKTINNCIKNKIIPVYGKGLQIRDWLFVKDTVNAIYNIILKGKIGENYNISTKNELSNIKLVNKICDYFKKKQIKQVFDKKKLIRFVQDRPGHDFRYSLNNIKLKSIGWKYKTNFEKKLYETIEWYLSR